MVVLEIQSENSKSTADAEPCTLRELLHELEENGVVDVSLHAHSVERPGTSEDSGSGASTIYNIIMLMKKCKIAKSHGVSQELSQSQQSPCQVLTSSRWKLATWSRFSHTPLVWQTWNSLRLRAPSLVRLDLYHRKVVENPYLNQTKAILLTTKWYCHAIWFGDRSWKRAQPWPDTGVCNSQRLTRTRRMLKYCAVQVRQTPQNLVREPSFESFDLYGTLVRTSTRITHWSSTLRSWPLVAWMHHMALVPTDVIA